MKHRLPELLCACTQAPWAQSHTSKLKPNPIHPYISFVPNSWLCQPSATTWIALCIASHPAEKRDLSGNNEEPWPGKRDYSSLHPVLASLCFGVAIKLVGGGSHQTTLVLGAQSQALAEPCRAHAHLQGLAHGAWGDPESGRRWGWTLWRQRVLRLCLPSLAVSTVARRPRQGSSRQMGPSPREQPSVAAPALLLPAGSGLGRAPGAAPLPRRCTQLLHGPTSYPSLKHTSN